MQTQAHLDTVFGGKLADPPLGDGAGSFGPPYTPVGPQPGDPSALQSYTQEYAYDEVGNLLEVRHIAATGSYTRRYDYAPDGNRLLATSEGTGTTFPDTYGYDAHGNLTSLPHIAELRWDADDQLERATPGSQTVSYHYGADGARVRKYVQHTGTTTDERIYIGPWEVYRRRTGSPASLQTERTTLHVADDMGALVDIDIKTVDAGTPVATPSPIQRHQLTSHLASAHTELDEAGNIISHEEYHPFGTTSYRAHDSTLDVPTKRYRYTGAERDEETALYHMGARYYAPWLARWTAPDPLGLADGPNRYAYARNNPATLSDPTGTRAGIPDFDFSDEPLRVTGDMPAPEEEAAKMSISGGQSIDPGVGAEPTSDMERLEQLEAEIVRLQEMNDSLIERAAEIEEGLQRIESSTAEARRFAEGHRLSAEQRSQLEKANLALGLTPLPGADFGAAAASIAFAEDDPSLGNIGAAVFDVLAAALPGVPAFFGGIKKVGKGDEIAGTIGRQVKSSGTAPAAGGAGGLFLGGVDDVIASAARPSRAGSATSRAVQALQKKISNPSKAANFGGLRANEATANSIIREVFGARNPVFRTSTNRAGQEVIDVLNPSTGRGVRILKESGAFDTFVNF